MKSSKSSGIFRPFEDLNAMLEKRSLPITPCPLDSPINHIEANLDPDNEKKLFMEAMADVKPISRDKCIEKNIETPQFDVSENDTESEMKLRLENLVRYGKGFVVADTPEYIEGTGYNVSPQVTKRLHRGDFSLQGHIDLHGFNVKDAQEAFENFLKAAVMAGKSSVLIVHGRGLSSPAKPVLKAKVYEWLTSGQWRKWVIAFSSARSYDGGTGATYVLLRQRPLTKRFRKRTKSLFEN